MIMTRLGRRVPRGSGFKMGVVVIESMSTISSLGVQKVDLSSEVCHHPEDMSEENGPCSGLTCVLYI